MPLWAALLLAVPLLAGEPPPVSLTVSDEVGEAAFRPRYSLLGGELTLRPVFKAGVLALTESFPYPYPILNSSPYVMAGTSVKYSGRLEAMVVATIGAVNLRSHRILSDPDNELASPANAYQGDSVSQAQWTHSIYADVGKRFDAGGGWKGAFYLSISELGYKPLAGGVNYGADYFTEGSLGTAWLKRWGNQTLTLSGAAVGETAPPNAYRNTETWGWVPAGKVGAEYAVETGGGRWLAGAQVHERRADHSVRAWTGVQGRDVSFILGLDKKKSKSDFFPDATALAATVQGQAAKDLTVGFTLRREEKSYAMAPGPERDTRGFLEFTWTPGADTAIKAAKNWGDQKNKPTYDPDKQRALNAAISDSERKKIRAAVAGSPTLGEFYGAYKPGGSLEILAAASEFTSLFDRYNYNHDEGKPENLDQVDQMYRRTRDSYLKDAKDPTLVCLGAAQYAAIFAEELGRRNGVQIQASAMTVEVLDERGKLSGHAATQIKTKEHGIVWVDWGRLIPTYTWDTERALRVYQGLVGAPALWHMISDPSKNGQHVGYLFTEEGKLYINNMTFHGELNRSPAAKIFADDPRSDGLAAERYKGLLRDK